MSTCTYTKHRKLFDSTRDNDVGGEKNNSNVQYFYGRGYSTKMMILTFHDSDSHRDDVPWGGG